MRVSVKGPIYTADEIKLNVAAEDHFTSDDPEWNAEGEELIRQAYRLFHRFGQRDQKWRKARLETIAVDCVELERQGKAKLAEIEEHENHSGDWTAAHNAASRRGAAAKAEIDQLGENPPPRAGSTAEERAAWQRKIDAASRDMEQANWDLQDAQVRQRNLWLFQRDKLNKEYEEIDMKLAMLDEEKDRLLGKAPDLNRRRFSPEHGLQILGPDSAGIPMQINPPPFGSVA
jgi:hypothetical protein